LCPIWVEHRYTVIAEPDTLVPHEYESLHRMSMHVTLAGEATTIEQIDASLRRYVYD
jgi:hypothetical protein